MEGIRHPLSGAVYDLEADGTITVALDGRTGSFTKAGVYVSGEVKECDPHLCVWVGGKRMPSRYEQLIIKED